MSKILLQTAAPNLDASCRFYETTGFVKTAQSGNHHVYSDVAFDILVNGEVGARPGFRVYTDDLPALKTKLTSFGPLFPHATGFVTSDPNGVRVFLLPVSEYPSIDKSMTSTNNMCGNNYGAGIETTKFDESIAFWQALGYQPSTEITKNSQYATLTFDGSLAITFFQPGICPHAFYNPSLTYFNGKEGNPVVIAKLRHAGIKPVEEITEFNDQGEVDNIIISDPGGLHSFIYNDG